MSIGIIYKYTLIFGAYCTLVFNVECAIILSKKGGDILLRYKTDILQLLKDAGYSTYKIRKEKIFTESQLQNIRDNKLLTQDALNKLCNLLSCQPGDILEYVPDNEESEV